MNQVHKADYPLFDWLRFVLASLVYWEHANITEAVHPGNFAVQVFFALSGWLIGGILLETRAPGLPRFFYNRVTRIWLPYLLAVILLYGFAVAKDGFAPYFWQTLAFDLTFTHNWFIEKIPAVIQAMPMQGTGSHLWSIAVEEQFYLVAPLLLVLTPLRNWASAWAIIAALAIWAGTNYGAISCGVLAVMLQRRYGDWHLKPVAVAAMAVLLVALTVAFWGGILGYRYAAPIAAILIVLLAARPGLRGKIGVFFGGISFPFYLNHWLGLFAGNAALSVLPQMGRLPAMTLGFVFATGVAAVAWYLVDRNIHIYRGRLYTPALGRACMIAAYAVLAIGLLLGTVIIGPLDSAPAAP